MVSHIRRWISLRELISIARQPELTHCSPSEVLEVLRSYALSKMQSTDTYFSFLHSSIGVDREREALLTIWQAARKAYLQDSKNRSGWHSVMANCNGLYEQLRRNEGETAPKRQVA